MPTWSRRRFETTLLAALAITSVVLLRSPGESRPWLLAEFGTICLTLVVAECLRTFSGQWKGSKLLTSSAAAAISTTPILFALIARAFGSPIAFEMSLLTVFGTVSLAMAISATTSRIASLSLVVSGFLVLFCASISEGKYAAVLPMVWMLGCVWHLVANHWERLDLAMPDSVQRTWTLRPSLMIIALVVLVTGGFAVKDRMSSNRLTFGWMPTSGGNKWSDPAARDGVGTGDEAIAAKDHAESFGAVDSSLFLESTEQTLFDMFNDMIGDPNKITKSSVRAQAMNNENFIPSHERLAKSERGGGTFSTERTPPKKHHHFKDAKEASVVQWDGPTGIRLAMERHDTFDGSDWSQSANWRNEKLTRVDSGEATWYFDPAIGNARMLDPDKTSVGLLKVIRLDSQRLPVPMMTAGVHIKDIDRQDFYGISKDGSFYMPGREKVPALTVVHIASVNLMEDEIRETLSSQATTIQIDPNHAGNSGPASRRGIIVEELAQLVNDWTSDAEQPYEKLRSILMHLRTEFTFDRDGETTATSLKEFLKSRRGGDHLFATTAALMAERIGLSSRLVTGFYVRPDAFDIAAGHASVLPQDVHVWAEVQLEGGRWFEIEPTPGYREPYYRPSWQSLARRFAAANWPVMAGGLSVLAGIYACRRLLIDWMLAAIWSLAAWLRPRNRIRLAILIIEMRARLVGQRRPVGQSQRAWLEQLTHADAKIASAAKQFSDAADRLFFGRGTEPMDHGATCLVKLLRVHTINSLTKEATS